MLVILAIVGILSLICVAYYIIQTKFPSMGKSINDGIDGLLSSFKRKKNKEEK